MRIGILSNIDNGSGLQQDYELFRSFAEELGHEVTGVHHRKSHPVRTSRFDLLVCLEVLGREFHYLSDNRWLVPNLEYLEPHADISNFDLILAKTRLVERVLERHHPNVVFTGWTSRDIHDPDVPSRSGCLHVWGQPKQKGGHAVCEAWRQAHDRLPPLTIVSRRSVPDGPWKVLREVGDVAVANLLNQSLVIVQPSAMEGFGVILREALSTGALLVTTDGAPMNELNDCAWCVAATPGPRFGRSPTWNADPNAIVAAVTALVDHTSPADIKIRRERARRFFLNERHRFHTEIVRLLQSLSERIA